MKDNVILVVIAKFVIPFILLFALYIQFHGEYSPGGGFQAGVIFATAFILYGLIYSFNKLLEIISQEQMLVTATIGVLLYIGTGFLTMFLGGNFLDYNMLHENNHTAQQIGIIVIELGVGIAVFATMLLSLSLFVIRKDGK